MIGTPLTQVVGDRFEAAGAGPNAADARERRRIHVQLSAMWGIGLLLEVVIRLVVIDVFSVDTANGVNSVITLVVIGLLVLATVMVGRRNAPSPAA
jgi:hypothetical protein